MKQFFKFTFASCLGTILALGFIVFIFFMIGISSAPSGNTPKDSVLHLKFNLPVPELTNNIQQSEFSFSKEDFVGLNDIAKLLQKAAKDKNIKGILIQTESTQLSPTTALHISKLIKGFSESGKFVHAYGNYFSQSGYTLASVADSVFINPNGFIDLRGFGMIVPYFKEFSEKTDIEFDVYHAGKFKSAVEPFYLDKSSSNNRLQTQKYLNTYQNEIINSIAHNRDIAAHDVLRILDQGLSNTAENAIDFHLVDEIKYWGEYEEGLKKSQGLSKLKLLSLQDYYKMYKKPSQSSNDRIAIIYAEGEVAFGGKEKGTISMERYDKMLTRIIKNKKIKAVVLRVNSPGGSSLTSDLFWHKIEELKDAGKYVVASFGKYAASGGYYISCGADKIVSEPTTLTGSIGVFSMIPDMSEFFDNKLGIFWDTIGTGDHTFMYSTLVSRSKSDNEKLMRDTEYTYAKFKDRVSKGRHIDLDRVEEIAQGRVWSGYDALEVGLVDTLGGITDALKIAAVGAEISDYKLLEYPVIKKSFYEELMSELLANTEVMLPESKSISSRLSKNLNQLLSYIESACTSPQARLPFMIEAN